MSGYHRAIRTNELYQVCILANLHTFDKCKRSISNLLIVFLFSARADNEFSDSEDEGEGGRRDNRSYKRNKRPRLETPATGSDAEVKDEKDSKSKYSLNHTAKISAAM